VQLSLALSSPLRVHRGRLCRARRCGRFADELYASEFCNGILPLRNIDLVACDGTFSVLTAVPSLFGATCEEMCLAIAPSQSANARFSPRDVLSQMAFLSIRSRHPIHPIPLARLIYLRRSPDVGCSPDHTGIAFDHVGTFGNDMIVTCKGGGGNVPSVWKVDNLRGGPHVTHVADVVGADEIEGPAVVPTTFGPKGGQIWVADETVTSCNGIPGALHAISNTGVGTLNIVCHNGAESVQVIPDPIQCTFCNTPRAAPTSRR
jgi:hypothetical protein